MTQSLSTQIDLDSNSVNVNFCGTFRYIQENMAKKGNETFKNNIEVEWYLKV